MFYELLMAKARKQKQQDYIELEYLESTGTQYIDTEVVGTENISIETGFEFTTTDVQYLFGSSVTYNTNTFCFSLNTAHTGKIYRAFIGATTGTYGNTGEVFSTKMSVNNAYFSINQIRLDNEVYDITTTTPFTTPTSMYLFAKSNNGKEDYFAKVKVKFFKIYDNGVLIQYLIPVLDKNLVPCMYDKVSGKYLYNQGSGEFKWKLPNQLEYIRTTGNSYTIIDVITDGSYTIEAKCRAVSIPDTTVRNFGGYMCQGDSSINNNPRSGIGCYNGRWHVGYNKTGQAGTCDTNLHVFKLVEFLKFGEDFNVDYFSVDGEQLAISHASAIDFYSNTKRKWAIGGRIQSLGFKNPLDAEHYYWKFWDGNDKLVAYIIPVLDENLTPCMYDLVSKKYFYNIGTGQFKGPDDNSLIV